MDPELQKQLQQLLATLLANAQDAATWAKGEIPLLVKEKIAFGRAWDTTFFVLCVLGLITMYRWPLRHWRAYKFNDKDNKWMAMVLFIMSPSCVLGLLALVSLYHTLLVWFAPRLYIVNWLFDLIREARSGS
jgi:hypothetical protein